MLKRVFTRPAVIGELIASSHGDDLHCASVEKWRKCWGLLSGT